MPTNNNVSQSTVTRMSTQLAVLQKITCFKSCANICLFVCLLYIQDFISQNVKKIFCLNTITELQWPVPIYKKWIFGNIVFTEWQYKNKCKKIFQQVLKHQHLD